MRMSTLLADTLRTLRYPFSTGGGTAVTLTIPDSAAE